jgi:hypothetical protein
MHPYCPVRETRLGFGGLADRITDRITVQKMRQFGQRIKSCTSASKAMQCTYSRGYRLFGLPLLLPPEAAGGQEVAGSSPVARTFGV